MSELWNAIILSISTSVRLWSERQQHVSQKNAWNFICKDCNDYLIIEVNCWKRNLDTAQPVPLKTLMNICGLLAIILEQQILN